MSRIEPEWYNRKFGTGAVHVLIPAFLCFSTNSLTSGICPGDAFGCFQVTDVVVSRDIILIGLPKAQDQIEQFDEVVMEFQVDMAREVSDARAIRKIVPVMG